MHQIRPDERLAGSRVRVEVGGAAHLHLPVEEGLVRALPLERGRGTGENLRAVTYRSWSKACAARSRCAKGPGRCPWPPIRIRWGSKRGLGCGADPPTVAHARQHQVWPLTQYGRGDLELSRGVHDQVQRRAIIVGGS